MTTTVEPEKSHTENSQPEALRPEDTPIEGTVFTPRQVGMLKVAVVVMGILLLAGLAALIAGLIYQASRVGQEAPTGPAAVSTPIGGDPVAMEPAKPGASLASDVRRTLDIPEGSEVVSMSLDGHLLALHVRSREDAEIVVVDLRSGKVVSRLSIEIVPGQ